MMKGFCMTNCIYQIFYSFVFLMFPNILMCSQLSDTLNICDVYPQLVAETSRPYISKGIEDPSIDFSFCINFFTNPKETGAIMSSGKMLAKKMTEGLNSNTRSLTAPDAHVQILEVGPGFGSFTHQMLQQGITPSQLTLIECQENFYKYLQQKFAHVNMIYGYAQDILKEEKFERKFDRIISGIPLKNISNKKERFALFLALFRSLKLGGQLTQFTYGTTSPIRKKECKKLERLLKCKISVQSNGWVFKNFPFAKVYTYSLENFISHFETC